MFAPIGRPFIIGIRGWVRANDCYRRNQPLDELGSERRLRVDCRLWAVYPESRITKAPNKASAAMLAIIALTGIVAGRTDDNARNTPLLLVIAHQRGYGDIFVNLRPMHANALADQPPMLAPLRGGIAQSREALQRR